MVGNEVSPYAKIAKAEVERRIAWEKTQKMRREKDSEKAQADADSAAVEGAPDKFHKGGRPKKAQSSEASKDSPKTRKTA